MTKILAILILALAGILPVTAMDEDAAADRGTALAKELLDEYGVPSVKGKTGEGEGEA